MASLVLQASRSTRRFSNANSSGERARVFFCFVTLTALFLGLGTSDVVMGMDGRDDVVLVRVGADGVVLGDVGGVDVDEFDDRDNIGNVTEGSEKGRNDEEVDEDD